MDYANIQHAVLLKGQARSSALEEVRGFELFRHHGELSLNSALLFRLPPRWRSFLGD